MPDTMQFAAPPAQTPAHTPAAAQPPPGPTYQAEIRAIKQGLALRKKYADKVWKPLYEAYVGRMMLFQTEPELEQRYAQYVSTLMPHLMGTEREVTCRVSRVSATEDADQKIALAALLGDQGTALLRACGVAADNTGRPGELSHAFNCAMWGMGVMLIGFRPPAGSLAAPADGDQEDDTTVDLDFADADHHELADAGMPWAISIDPRAFIGDGTYNDFSRGQWAAVEKVLSLAESKKLYPKYAEQLKASHKSAPEWENDRADEPRGQEDGVCVFYEIYHRNGTIVTIPCEECNCPHIMKVQPYDLGIEGLPFKFLGFEWASRKPYPIPPFARFFDAAEAEAQFRLTAMAAGEKIKAGIVVDETAAPGLANQIRTGDANAVYTISKAGKPIKEILETFDIGSLRAEHLTLSDNAGVAVERNAGMADLTLGRREKGDQTQAEINSRQAHIAARLAFRTDPARTFESAIVQGLLAVAYAKIDLLSGMMLAAGQGSAAQLVPFDVSRPMIGELIDYTFEVYVADQLTNADETAEAINLLSMLPNFAPLVAQEGHKIAFVPLIKSVLQKSRVRGADQALQPLSEEEIYAMQQQAAAAQMQQQAMPAAPPQPQSQSVPDAGGGTGMAPANAPDPYSQLGQLYSALQQLPEGDPAEEEIIAQIAQLTPQPQAA